MGWFFQSVETSNNRSQLADGTHLVSKVGGAMQRLLSVNVGLPRDISWQGRTVHTSVWKDPVQGRRMVRRLNIDGDGQGDLAGHGGEHRAVFVYQIDSYHYWQAQLGRSSFEYGQFGENFTVEGLPDGEVCIGDRYRIGSAVFEVTQPRVTCYRVGIRMNEPQMAALLVSHGRPGFYFRVLEEGEVEAGDEIVQVGRGPERMTIAEVNALLYKPGHPADRLEKALRIPALSNGWHSSFEALLERAQSVASGSGNPGLGPHAGPPPAWTGFRALRVRDKIRESGSVTSLLLKSNDNSPLTRGLPGQFVVLRLRLKSGEPPLLRSYSLSGEASDAQYRVSIKCNPDGAAGAYIRDEVQVGDIIEVAAPRGGFIIKSGAGPVILLSAGIGVTPVLAMLHDLAATMSSREIWWIHGARDGGEDPFAEEVRAHLEALPHVHRQILYSLPGPEDRVSVDFDASGRVNLSVLQALKVPRDADFYLCGPPAFMTDLTADLTRWGVAANCMHSETFGSGPALTPGVAATQVKPPHPPAGTAGIGPLVSFARSGLNVRWSPSFKSILELAEACDVPVRWSCRSGVCHNCETALISGTVAYQLDPIEPPAGGNILICCSDPTADIVLDL